MFIQTSETPNPNSLKFIPDCHVLKNRTAEFKSVDEAVGVSQLAEMLFGISGIEYIFLGFDFITITKSEQIHWDDIKTEIITIIMDFFVLGRPIMKDVIDNSMASSDESVIDTEIKRLIEERIRPAVAMDGGDITFHSYKDGIVFLEMRGSCSGCPSSTITLKNGIENMLKYYIPEIVSVESIN